MKHILVVDADKSLRSTYVSALETAGYSVAGVATAQAAVGACEDYMPDVIVLELQLQNHSGVELIHELRSYPEWQHIPVILNTLVPSADLKRFAEAFKTMGVAGCAYKPETSLRNLVSLVGDVVGLNQ